MKYVKLDNDEFILFIKINNIKKQINIFLSKVM